jgi:hypothetical protein
MLLAARRSALSPAGARGATRRQLVASVSASAAASATRGGARLAAVIPCSPTGRRISSSPRHRRPSPTQAAGAAAAATTSTQALATTLAPYALAAAAGIAFASACALALLPRSWPLTQAVARARWPLIPLSLAYAALLAASWEPDTLRLMMPGSLSEGLAAGKFAPQFFPTLDGVAALFRRPFTAASFLVHVAVANLVAARAVFWDASLRGVPAAHSILLCAVLGPVGVLAHVLTKALGLRSRGSARAVRLPGGGDGGSITLMPYTE